MASSAYHLVYGVDFLLDGLASLTMRTTNLGSHEFGTVFRSSSRSHRPSQSTWFPAL